MTAPRITRTGTMRVDVTAADIWDDRLVAAVVALRPEDADARALDGQRVRITIEPADVVPEQAPHGSSLDYLAELTGLLTGLCMTHAADSPEQTERALRRCMSLANTVGLAILAEKRGIK